VEMIVLDPGSKSFENLCPGSFYVGLSRATTMGDGNTKDSAIFFQGPNMTKQRLQNMTLKANTSIQTIKIQRRNHWIQHLNNNRIQFKSIENTSQLMKWGKTFRIQEEELLRLFSMRDMKSDVA
jgi:hypothetical protein